MKVLSLKPTIVKRFCGVAINWPFDTLRFNPLSLLSPNVCKLFNTFVKNNAAYLQSRISILHITPQRTLTWGLISQPFDVFPSSHVSFREGLSPTVHSTSTKTPRVWPPPLWVENRVITPGAFGVSHPGCASKVHHFFADPPGSRLVGNRNQWWLGAVGFFICWFTSVLSLGYLTKRFELRKELEYKLQGLSKQILPKSFRLLPRLTI